MDVPILHIYVKGFAQECLEWLKICLERTKLPHIVTEYSGELKDLTPQYVQLCLVQHQVDLRQASIAVPIAVLYPDELLDAWAADGLKYPSVFDCLSYSECTSWRLLRLVRDAEREMRLIHLLNGLPDGVTLSDANGRLWFSNAAMEQLVGGALDTVQWQSTIYPDALTRTEVIKGLRHTLELGGSHEQETQFVNKRGELCTVRVHSTIFQMGRHRLWLSHYRDLTEHKLIEANLRWSAYHDTLTELPNRKQLQENLADLLENKTLIKHEKLAFILLDLDGFKEINDTYGHRLGDETLRLIAKRISQNLKNKSSVYRLGGDEFAMIVQYTKSPSQLSEIMENLLQAIRQPLSEIGIIDSVSGSMGIALIEDGYGNMDSLVHAADVAMYRAKYLGKNQYQFADRGKIEKKDNTIRILSGIQVNVTRIPS